MKPMVFIMGKSEKETQALELIVVSQAKVEEDVIISKVLDLRNLKSVENGVFVPYKYVYEKQNSSGYTIDCKFIAKEQLKSQYNVTF